MPNGQVTTINEHRLKEAYAVQHPVRSDEEIEQIIRYKIGLVDHYLNIIKENVMPQLPNSTEVYLVIQSKANRK